MTDPDDCEHENRTYKQTDRENAPSTVYVEWYCDDCGAIISDVYEPAGHRIVFPEGDDEPFEEAIDE